MCCVVCAEHKMHKVVMSLENTDESVSPEVGISAHSPPSPPSPPAKIGSQAISDRKLVWGGGEEDGANCVNACITLIKMYTH